MFITRGMITNVNIGVKNSFCFNAVATGYLILSNKNVDAEAKLKDKMLITIDVDRDVLGALFIDR